MTMTASNTKWSAILTGPDPNSPSVLLLDEKNSGGLGAEPPLYRTEILAYRGAFGHSHFPKRRPFWAASDVWTGPMDKILMTRAGHTALETEKNAEIAALRKRVALLEGQASRLASIEKQLGALTAVEEEK